MVFPRPFVRQKVGSLPLVLLALLVLSCAAEEKEKPKSTDAPKTEKDKPAGKDDKSGDKEKPPSDKDKVAKVSGASQQRDLLHLSLEELMQIKVTIVSKRPEKLSESAAATYVITQEDIRRSGATTIAEALRMAPGVQVARMTSSQWAVSIRGFNDVFANKLLVLVDGRSVYTPNFSGVFWTRVDTMMEDIDRIEVIRGPGATMWGSNAVNGVINVVTKSAKDTQGGLVTASAGNEERAAGAVRYGGKAAKDLYIRGYVKYFDRDSQVLPGDHDGHDAWHAGQGGFRLDWDASKNDLVTLTGDVYRVDAGESASVPVLAPPFSKLVSGTSEYEGESILGRWTHTHSDTSNSKLQLYYTHTDQEKVAALIERRDTVDLDFQHQFAWGARQTILCGGGCRVSADHIDPGLTVDFNPRKRTLTLAGAFAQDEIIAIKDKLNVTLGARLEHNDFTGLEAQPTARVLWRAAPKHTVWAAVSRPVRIPSRVEDDVIFRAAALPPGALGPGSPVTLGEGIGDKDVESEKLLAFDLGYRTQPLKQLSIDLAGFANQYRDLRSTTPGAPFPETDPAPPHLVLPFRIGSRRSGQSYGGEAVVTWQARSWWRLQAQYSFLSIQLKDIRNDPDAEEAEGNSPRNQASLRSLIDLPHNVQLDWTVRYVDSLPNRDIHAYMTGDVRVGWQPLKRLEISVVGQNLFDNHHPEWRPTSPINTRETEVQRSGYLKATWKF
jgi:iron complex outermembrane receptor protein